ncbi:MAG: hypothetical protein N4A33_07560 [Bacteriovoracaceae bacterium]|jgi:hypothetical protein|nr:hypothetical protein [Bacteriovoracaceae bacterium]
MKKVLIIISNIAILLVAGFYFLVGGEKQVDLEKKAMASINIKLKLAKIISKTWRQGISNDYLNKCSLGDHNTQSSRCSTEALICFYKNSPLVLENKKYQLKVLKEDLINTYIEIGSYKFILEKKCHTRFLPKRIYSAGAVNYQKDIWDNFHEDVYIDKYYITNKEVLLWNNKLKIKNDLNPNTSLTLDQKKKFCHDKKMKLLQSRYLDAASFLPLRDSKTGYIYKFNSPFNKTNRVSRNCDVIFDKKCGVFNNYKDYAVSWVGINHVLGSIDEIIDNKIDPRYSLKQASLLSLGRKVLGDRVKGAFRCMASY